jgi:ectoine hydroxylase-related dioxygenase (phytanoyl-CoA dioxygenase family)
MLTEQQLCEFREAGHLTVANVLSDQQLASAVKDIEDWSAEFLQQLSADQQAWYLEPGSTNQVLRKLDNPVYHRDVFRSMACCPAVSSIVRQLMGSDVCVFFSQVFCKPPEVGGPKPVHQDNFYFGPDNPDSTLTVWIAIDEATEENGCLYYSDGSHRHGVLPHYAPEDEPFTLQLPIDVAATFDMTAAPVPAGGVSLHHGNTLHQSSANRSRYARRAVAFHYLAANSGLTEPALEYDSSVAVRYSW